MKKRTKLFTLIIAYFALLIIDGCTNMVDDPCGDISHVSLPFYDFEKIMASSMQSEVHPSLTLEIEMKLDELSYLSSNIPIKSNSDFGLINTAYGCSILADGYEGPKFPIEKIEVFSNQDFNGSYPANALLNEIVLIDNILSESPAQILLAEATQDDLQFMYPEDLGRFLTIEEHPDLTDVEHILTIKITKSNGDVMETMVGPITWL